MRNCFGMKKQNKTKTLKLRRTYSISLCTDVWMVEPCRPGPRWAETDKPRATHRCGRGTFGARSALKASDWSLTTRTITLTHIKCSTGQMSQCPEVRIHWGAQTFLFVHASQGKYERKPATLDNCSMCMWWEFSRPLFSTRQRNSSWAACLLACKILTRTDCTSLALVIHAKSFVLPILTVIPGRGRKAPVASFGSIPSCKKIDEQNPRWW